MRCTLAQVIRSKIAVGAIVLGLAVVMIDVPAFAGGRGGARSRGGDKNHKPSPHSLPTLTGTGTGDAGSGSDLPVLEGNGSGQQGSGTPLATLYGTGVGHGQTGYTPLSAVPIGTPIAPPPKLNLAQFNDMVLSVFALMDSPSADSTPQVRAMRAAIHDVDVKIAARNLPKRVAVAAKS